MKKKPKAQINLFFHDPNGMHWEKLPAQTRHKTRRLLAQLFFSFFNQQSKTKACL